MHWEYIYADVRASIYTETAFMRSKPGLLSDFVLLYVYIAHV